ncbi:MAG: DUF99 family protein [Candidatus Hadarchaeota archaeon]
MKDVKFWQVKPEIRILGVDDGPLDAPGKEVPLVGVVFRGGKWIDGVLKTTVTKDGTDATEKLVEMVGGSRHLEQLRVVMVDGVTFAGFNVIDVREVFRRLSIPVIVVSREMPNLGDILKAVRHLPEWRKRWLALKKAGKIHRLEIRRRKGAVYIQAVGLKLEDAARIVQLSSTRSLVPEPLRAAHMIATAMVKGESHGRV